MKEFVFLFNGLLALFCFLCFTSSVSFTAYHPKDEDLCNLVPRVSLLPFPSLAPRERKKRDPGNEVEIFCRKQPLPPVMERTFSLSIQNGFI